MCGSPLQLAKVTIAALTSANTSTRSSLKTPPCSETISILSTYITILSPLSCPASICKSVSLFVQSSTSSGQSIAPPMSQCHRHCVPKSSDPPASACSCSCSTEASQQTLKGFPGRELAVLGWQLCEQRNCGDVSARSIFVLCTKFFSGDL